MIPENVTKSKLLTDNGADTCIINNAFRTTSVTERRVNISGYTVKKTTVDAPVGTGITKVTLEK